MYSVYMIRYSRFDFLFVSRPNLLLFRAYYAAIKSEWGASKHLLEDCIKSGQAVNNVLITQWAEHNREYWFPGHKPGAKIRTGRSASMVLRKSQEYRLRWRGQIRGAELPRYVADERDGWFPELVETQTRHDKRLQASQILAPNPRMVSEQLRQSALQPRRYRQQRTDNDDRQSRSCPNLTEL